MFFQWNILAKLSLNDLFVDFLFFYNMVMDIAVVEPEDQEAMDLLKTSVFKKFAEDALIENAEILTNATEEARLALQQLMANGSLMLNNTEFEKKAILDARKAVREGLATSVAEYYAELLVQIFSIQDNPFHQRVFNEASALFNSTSDLNVAINQAISNNIEPLRRLFTVPSDLDIILAA